MSLRDNEQDVISDYESGMGVYALAKKYGVSHSPVYRFLKRRGIQFRDYSIKCNNNKVLDDYRDGLSSREVAQKHGISPASVLRLCHRFNIPLHSKDDFRLYTFNENAFDNMDDEYSNYWMGFLFADGCNDGRGLVLDLKTGDKSHLRKFCSFLSFSGPIVDRKPKIRNGKTYKMSGVTICSTSFANKLSTLGCVRRKSLKLEFPKWLDSDKVSHFLRGYFDGDGTLSLSPSRLSGGCAITSSTEFCLHIKKLLSPIINFKIQHLSGSKKSAFLRNSKRFEFIKFLDYIYENSDVYLDRKYNLYQELKSGLRRIQ